MDRRPECLFFSHDYPRNSSCPLRPKGKRRQSEDTHYKLQTCKLNRLLAINEKALFVCCILHVDSFTEIFSISVVVQQEIYCE
jgi:hypothetical protein